MIRALLVFLVLKAPAALTAQERSITAPESDSAVIARERAVWQALKDNDTTGVVRLVGSYPTFVVVSPNGIGHTSAARLARGQAKSCTTHSFSLDSARVEHPSETTELVTYRVNLDRTCSGNLTSGPLFSMSVWVRRNGRWEGVAQSIAEPHARK